MATIRKQHIGLRAETGRDIGEDKSFGRATLRQSAPRKSGLNPLNTAAAREDVLIDPDPVVPAPFVMSTHHTRH